MSDTKKDKIDFPVTKNSKSHRANPYGLCRCRHCTFGRRKSRHSIVEKIKHKQRTAWKTNKQEQKGAYTD